MRILINCSNLRRGGTIQVAHSFLNEIKFSIDNQYIVVCSSSLYRQLRHKEFSNKFTFYNYDIKANPLNSLTGKNTFLSSLVKKHSVESVFTVFGPGYWRPKVFHISGYAKPQYVYKDSPFFEEISLKERIKLKIKEFFHMQDFKKNCNVIITENEDVSFRLRTVFRKKIFTVTNYYNQVFDKRIEKKSFGFSENDEIRLLTVAANYPHKNLKIIPPLIDYLIKAYPGVNFNFMLTIDKHELEVSEKAKKHIKFLGSIDIDDCPGLYQNCDFMFLPTLLECFSASYCEAMKMKKPILTSDLNFAKGICKNAAYYFEPLSVKSIGEAIHNLWIDKEKQKELIELGSERLHSFDDSKTRAEKYISIIINETNDTMS